MNQGRRESLAAKAIVGRDVFRLAVRQRHVDPGVRIENRKREHSRLYLEFPCNHVEQRRIRNVPARGRCHHITIWIPRPERSRIDLTQMCARAKLAP
jgi:hypothetical protein